MFIVEVLGVTYILLYKKLKKDENVDNSYLQERNNNVRTRTIPLYILKGKRNAYFEFLNVGFILRTYLFLISAINTHK